MKALFSKKRYYDHGCKNNHQRILTNGSASESLALQPKGAPCAELGRYTGHGSRRPPRDAAGGELSLTTLKTEDNALRTFNKINARAAGTFFAVGLGALVPTGAAAYPVDCAILLCLAGGWPANAECKDARSVFIDRITPRDVEPPLQIWNCPMSASASGSSGAAKGADIDISGSEYDYVRSIRVFHIERARQWRTGKDNCNRRSQVRAGLYGDQGDYAWRSWDIEKLPEAFEGLKGWGEDCPGISQQSVFVEWTDYSGAYGFEQIDY